MHDTLLYHKFRCAKDHHDLESHFITVVPDKIAFVLRIVKTRLLF